jgi:hypothetical protein
MASMIKPDLVLLRQGKPVAVVEAKARPVPAPFQDAVRRQLLRYATATGSPWSILVDPDQTMIFRKYEINRPWSILATSELLGITDVRSETIGERVLLQAIARWVRELPDHREVLSLHPELRDFLKDVSDGLTSTEEWPPKA